MKYGFIFKRTHWYETITKLMAFHDAISLNPHKYDFLRDFFA